MPSPDAVATFLKIANERFPKEEGQDLLEYGLLASLIAIFALGAVKLLADQITNVFWGAIATKF